MFSAPFKPRHPEFVPVLAHVYSYFFCRYGLPAGSIEEMHAKLTTLLELQLKEGSAPKTARQALLPPPILPISQYLLEPASVVWALQFDC